MCLAPQRRVWVLIGHRNLSKVVPQRVQVFCTFWLANVLRATAACHFWIGTSKLVRTLRCFAAFWLANVLRATAACHFWTSELQKLAPTRVVFCAFWLANVLRATAACHFSGSQLQKWLRDREVFWAFWLTNVLRATAACHFSPVCWTATSAPAALARLLFEHQEPQIIEKTQRFSASLTFRARVPAFYWLYTRVDLLSADLTSLLCLTPLLCFSTLHIVGS